MTLHVEAQSIELVIVPIVGTSPNVTSEHQAFENKMDDALL